MEARLRHLLREQPARTVDALPQAISEATATIPPNNAFAWFVPCGYDLQ